MFTFGFYNSLNGDRKYNAFEMSKLFDGIILDGVFEGIGQHFAVTAGGGMSVNVGTGRAWLNHTWNENDAIMPVNLPESDLNRSRYDAIVIEVGDPNTDRTNAIKVVSGTPAVNPSKPVLNTGYGGNSAVDDETLPPYQHALAYILVQPGVEEITAADIEIVVGMDEMPFVTGPVETRSIEDLFNQWDAQFAAWFSNLKAQLTDNVVTNLQAQIDSNREEIERINGTFKVEIIEHTDIFTENGQFINPLAKSELIVDVTVVGGGQGGGTGSGGNGGRVARSVITIPPGTTPIPVNVGLGGTYGGGSGGTTSFGEYLSAAGGSGSYGGAGGGGASQADLLYGGGGGNGAAYMNSSTRSQGTQGISGGIYGGGGGAGAYMGHTGSAYSGYGGIAGGNGGTYGGAGGSSPGFEKSGPYPSSGNNGVVGTYTLENTSEEFTGTGYGGTGGAGYFEGTNVMQGAGGGGGGYGGNGGNGGGNGGFFEAKVGGGGGGGGGYGADGGNGSNVGTYTYSNGKTCKSAGGGGGGGGYGGRGGDAGTAHYLAYSGQGYGGGGGGTDRPTITSDTLRYCVFGSGGGGGYGTNPPSVSGQTYGNPGICIIRYVTKELILL